MKKIVILLFVVIANLQCFGETVSQKEAQNLALMFFNEASGKVTAPPKLVYNGKRLTTNRLFTPFYVYNTPMGGFVIISAENKAYPILAYSLKESFDPDKIGETETALLKSYATEIELVRYDTEPIEETVWAWQNFPEYVDLILKARYNATDPKLSTDDSYLMVSSAIEKEDAVYADLYTPTQWRDMMEEELSSKEVVPIGVFNGDNMFPAVIYGRKGEYFRIEMSSRNDWLVRLNATEVIPSQMVSVVANSLALPSEIEEPLPFEELDDFLSEVMEIENRRKEVTSIDIPLMQDAPMVHANGGGHYEIDMPENVVTATIYNLAGASIRRNTYPKESSRVFVDLSAEPSGFYIVNLIGETGQPYSLKLAR